MVPNYWTMEKSELIARILLQDRTINSLVRELNRFVKNSRISKTKVGKKRGPYKKRIHEPEPIGAIADGAK